MRENLENLRQMRKRALWISLQALKVNKAKIETAAVPTSKIITAAIRYWHGVSLDQIIRMCMQDFFWVFNLLAKF